MEIVSGDGYFFMLMFAAFVFIASCGASFVIGLLLGRLRVADGSHDVLGRVRPGGSFQAAEAGAPDSGAGIFHEDGVSSFQAADADTAAAFSALAELDSHINRAIRATARDRSAKNDVDILRQKIAEAQARENARMVARSGSSGGGE